MAETMISADEADEMTEEACKVALSGEPTKTQLRLARFVKITDAADAVHSFPGTSSYETALALKRQFDKMPGDHDSEFDDCLTNIARSKAVAKLVDDIVARLVASGVKRAAQVSPDLLDDHLGTTDERNEREWLAREGVQGTAMADAFGMLVELRV